MATQTSSPPPPPPPPPLPPTESVGRRSKFIWPLLIAASVSIGAYLYMKTNKDEKTQGDVPVPAPAVTSSTPTTTPTAISTASVSPPPPAVMQPVKPIPVDQQRELFKWILEEKRKVKTKDPQEKKKIDEEKALLKQFIRSKSIPSL
ncbi:uncharacterized protein [Rutidosis leptorrhynchoides]|uniref:uncharacterized protein n=1 Tax=Rutidosis leptorrhynchoides TaxID=125765 RepID=UPI003A997BA3